MLIKVFTFTSVITTKADKSENYQSKKRRIPNHAQRHNIKFN